MIYDASRITIYLSCLTNYSEKTQKPDPKIDLEKECETVRQRLSEKEAEFNVASEESQRLETLRNDIREKNSELIERRNTILAELSRSTSRKGVLEEMDNDFEGYSRSVKSVMTANADEKL